MRGMKLDSTSNHLVDLQTVVQDFVGCNKACCHTMPYSMCVTYDLEMLWPAACTLNKLLMPAKQCENFVQYICINLHCIAIICQCLTGKTARQKQSL